MLYLDKPNQTLLSPCGVRATAETRLCDERLYTLNLIPTRWIYANTDLYPLQALRLERDQHRASYAETAVCLLRAMELNLDIHKALSNYGDTYFLEITWPRHEVQWVQDLDGYPRPNPDVPPLSPTPRLDGELVNCFLIGLSQNHGLHLIPFILSNLQGVKISGIDGHQQPELVQNIPFEQKWVDEGKFQPYYMSLRKI